LELKATPSNGNHRRAHGGPGGPNGPPGGPDGPHGSPKQSCSNQQQHKKLKLSQDEWERKQNKNKKIRSTNSTD